MTHVLVKLYALAVQLPCLSVLTRDGKLARLRTFLQTSGHGLNGARGLVILLFLCRGPFWIVRARGLLTQSDQGCQNNERQRSKHHSFHILTPWPEDTSEWTA